MAISKPNETLIGREVNRLFNEMHASRGGLCWNPVTGARFVYGLDPIKPQKDKAYRALLAREWFVINGPADAPPLPVDLRDSDGVRWSGGPLNFITARYTGSLANNRYDLSEHPSFAAYISGVLWEDEKVGGTYKLPFTPEELAELKRRFPPLRLEGLSHLCWSRPKRKKKTIKRDRSQRTRS